MTAQRTATDDHLSSRPRLHQHGVEIQTFGHLRLMPIALAHDARLESAQLLNQILGDTAILHSLYKEHHWLMRGHTSTSCTFCWTCRRADRSHR